MRALRMPRPRPDAPSDLSAASQEIWRDVADQCCDAGRRILLRDALRLWDRAEAARRIVEAEGLTKTTSSTGTVHAHPMAIFELRSRQQFAKIWKQLGLDKETDDF